MKDSADSFNPLCQDLVRRLNAPVKSITFYKHLFFLVLFCGGFGIWYTLLRDGLDFGKLTAALLTYFPAIVASAVIDLEHEEQKYLRSFGDLIGGFFLAVFILAIFSGPAWQLYWAFMGTFLSVFFWWFANGDNARFKDVNVTPINAVAGTTDKPLSGKRPKNWKT